MNIGFQKAEQLRCCKFHIQQNTSRHPPNSPILPVTISKLQSSFSDHSSLSA